TAVSWDAGGLFWPRIPWLLNRGAGAGLKLDLMNFGPIEGEAGYRFNKESGYGGTCTPGGPYPGTGNPAQWVAHWQNIIAGTRQLGFLGKWLMPVYECWAEGDKPDTDFQAGVMPIISYVGQQWPGANLDAINVGGRVA